MRYSRATQHFQPTAAQAEIGFGGYALNVFLRIQTQYSPGMSPRIISLHPTRSRKVYLSKIPKTQPTHAVSFQDLKSFNRTFPCLWDATTQKITGQYNMKPLNSPTDDQETTYTTVEAVDATLQYLSQELLPHC